MFGCVCVCVNKRIIVYSPKLSQYLPVRLRMGITIYIFSFSLTLHLVNESEKNSIGNIQVQHASYHYEYNGMPISYVT